MISPKYWIDAIGWKLNQNQKREEIKNSKAEDRKHCKLFLSFFLFMLVKCWTTSAAVISTRQLNLSL